MATAQTLAAVDIPGIHHSPTDEDFADSRNVTWASFLFATTPIMPSVFISCMLISRSPRAMSYMGSKSRFRAIPNPPDGAFVPYEFQEGEAPSKAVKISKVFFQELAGFLHFNNLAGLVALQLLDGPRDRTNTELLVGPQSTLMMDTKDVLGLDPAQITTGWFFKVGEDGVISCKGGDVYAPKKNTHGVFQDLKPLSTLETLKEALLEEGIIARSFGRSLP
ncbi:hypothetical protein TOPH_06856 [Tolypocladium ophioglossoides CBS 100239]|uniref:Uncharacterized protein n=1 Tax=Tolypocladium ophioglossoides (strain CBS 100239) TaxID=1163406 RepID=A0A0L0N355_TOLOC|nr:hypothetical protein TOPH_06856 [Tolypocladium ophioglossoides CBS 100239]